MIKNAFYRILLGLSLLLLLPSSGVALGLGHITVYSNLNEPLKVGIELVNSKSMSIDQISVRNAHTDTYRDANLPRPNALNGASFKARKTARGSIVVDITSKKPVKEPFITFIAELIWPEGRLNREYTFLLDPPKLIQRNLRVNKTQKAPEKIKKPSATNSLKNTNAKSKSKTRISQSNLIEAHENNETYTVRAADTLSAISRKVRPDNSVTTYQTMQTIFALNPKAFIKNNIDLIKQGSVLKLPTANEILQFNGKPTRALAKTPTKRSNLPKSIVQTTALRPQEKSPAKKMPTAEKIPENTNVAAADKIEDTAKLKIIPSTEELLEQPVNSKDDLSLINRALKTSIDTIKLLQHENQSLADRVQLLTKKLEQLDSHNQHLNEKISEVSVLLKNKLSPNKPTQAELAAAETEMQAARANTDEGTSSSQMAKNEAQTTLSVDSELTRTNQQRPAFINSLLSNPIIALSLLIFVILILVLLFFFLRKRNKKARNRRKNTYSLNNTNSETKSADGTGSNSTKNATGTKSQKSSLTDSKNKSVDEIIEDDQAFSEYFDQIINASGDSNEINEIPVPKKKSVPEENSFNLDISDEEIEYFEKNISQNEKPIKQVFKKNLSNVDTYMAYADYQKASNILLNNLEKYPDDKSLHLKLFKCYALSNKHIEYAKHANSIIALLKSDQEFRRRIESNYLKTWKTPLEINE